MRRFSGHCRGLLFLRRLCFATTLLKNSFTSLIYQFTSRHVTSRHATSRHITSRHVTSRHVTPRHVTPHHVTLWHAMPRPSISSQGTSRRVTTHATTGEAPHSKWSIANNTHNTHTIHTQQKLTSTKNETATLRIIPWPIHNRCVTGNTVKDAWYCRGIVISELLG